MVWKSKSLVRSSLVIVAALAVVSCDKRPQVVDNDTGPAGEPEQYSATVVRIVEDGTRREAAITREARSGELRRQDWTERGEARAIIWRPDLGKCFLLDVASRTYVELAMTPEASEQEAPNSAGGHIRRQTPNHGGSDPNGNAFQGIDRVLDQPLSPISVETRVLPDETIEGHSCTVFERRAAFADAHTEITRTSSARDLAGLALRVESIGANNTRVITERRDVRTEVSADIFQVPAEFTRVDKLPH